MDFLLDPVQPTLMFSSENFDDESELVNDSNEAFDNSDAVIRVMHRLRMTYYVTLIIISSILA